MTANPNSGTDVGIEWKGGQLVPCLQQMPLICLRTNLTGKHSGRISKGFKAAGPSQFINFLSCVYLTEYIIHSGTSFNLVIHGQMGFFFGYAQKTSSSEQILPACLIKDLLQVVMGLLQVTRGLTRHIEVHGPFLWQVSVSTV